MPISCTEILVRLRRPPDIYQAGEAPSNHIRIRISPDMAIAMGMLVLSPAKEAVEAVEMVVNHHPESNEMDAYERVLGEAMAGDATLFAREDYVEEAWRIVDPVLRADTPVHEYEPGTWGPTAEGPSVVPAGGWHVPVLAPSTVSHDAARAA
jgi:glucose-6-phosphate 1-dehydrogenase